MCLGYFQLIREFNLYDLQRDLWNILLYFSFTSSIYWALIKFGAERNAS